MKTFILVMFWPGKEHRYCSWVCGPLKIFLDESNRAFLKHVGILNYFRNILGDVISFHLPLITTLAGK